MTTSDIITRVWGGVLHVKFQLDPVLATEECPFYYATLYRNSFLHSSLADLVQFYKPHLKDPSLGETPNWWFEFEKVPLKWNLPIGLLYDLTTTDSQAEKQAWELTLRYHDYPVEYVIPIEPNTNFLKSYWINQLKEACFILNGSSKLVMNMSRTETDEFYQAAIHKESVQYETAFRRLLPSNISSLKNIPIKIYLPLSNKLIQPVIANVGRKLTLGNLLQSLIPDLFPSSLMYTVAHPVSHGVVLPIDSPVVDLYICMKSLDAFLHISIRMIQKSDLD
ncbi:hypothetical protein OGAPHI_002083 [Ogataea philodendri]|uniref:Autophagy protein 5 n=1 Tax=Ogataea philodendri TaxID=1378263 RepID=A0A9P8T7C8_9ASCO|nr:uncharacterized protein OGAPHI_002083 [Ogataea philodendri]KAH3668329.1 hypothetical protein OGAPHI_002083 [Ogataea philodendri]